MPARMMVGLEFTPESLSGQVDVAGQRFFLSPIAFVIMTITGSISEPSYH